MIDGFGRKIDYLRISVTDRCNFRCQYCMPENITFMSRDKVMDYTEISLLAERFIHHGIKKIRLTGGEPLVRRNIDVLIEQLGKYVRKGDLEELTLTTNGSTLTRHSDMLYKNELHRINISLDSLNAHKFNKITKGGDLDSVLRGIEKAKQTGLEIKINMVALKQQNQDEIMAMAHYCAYNGFSLSLIETMPLGNDISGRLDHYIPLDEFITPLSQKYNINAIDYKSSGPAQYYFIEELGIKLGLITPLSDNFCNNCNRLRLTTDGKLYMCLGSDMHLDFKEAIRNGGTERVDNMLQKALKLKPEKHYFEDQMTDKTLSVSRHMNVTGG